MNTPASLSTLQLYSNENLVDTGKVNPYALIQQLGGKRRSFRKTKRRKGKKTRNLRQRKSRKHRKSRHFKK
uniref:Uncharacterized protein n=1 Tax=viral metagenome TaxID=1070528 RepID=A0A6C0F7S0_9ZZZZ